MVELIGKELEAIQIGTPRMFRNLVLFPLLGGRPNDADYLTLDDALAAGSARVTEVDESGSVPQLRFRNSGLQAVLLLDGEELIGAKQNRVLNLSILAPAGREIQIPVSCVEAGRWLEVSPAFSAAPRTQYAAGRARKMAAVSHSMSEVGERHSDQHEVWADIASKAERLSSRSDTGAMAAIYDSHATDVEAFVRELPPVEGQCGAVFAIEGQLVGLDLFDYQATLQKLLPKLVRSYALDAVDAAIGGGQAPPRPTSPEEAARLLSRVAHAAGQAFPAVGEGEDVRLSAPGLTGGALLARERLVHLSAFHIADSSGSGRLASRSRISRPSLRRGV
jgi:hypothetical protein